ncbi:sister chromatid cohesion protein PDS5 homolog D-like isoform X2 [Rutidosis leptorrhynchoides]|uniref:sister chromatid cohesion protein PDS5 homolog D-like isoform X2 n=1 Tax=Rutidosis leptorrhynchoides TaxID=125765 RepID=UPI003A995016
MDCEYQVNTVEQQLKEAGQRLSVLPSSTKQLLVLLDKIEQLLTCVGQSPSISMQGALVPSMGALIGHELIKHPDINVRVSVASCLSEIARITAPEQPYKDEIMKEIFQLNVMAFGELSNMSGHTYHKAIHILESVAKLRSFLLMLDLQCDALVLAMFEQFLSKTRSNHPHRVYSDMETIMTLMIKESDEISFELLSLLISHVRKENQNVSPVTWNLTEKVLMNCIDIIKPYSETIMKLINSDPDSYADVATLLCHNANGNEHVETKSTKWALSSLENGGSTKKQKYNDRDRLKGKELETPKRGRPKNKINNSYQDNSPNNNLVHSHEDARRSRLRDKSKGTKSSTGQQEKHSTITDDEISSDYDGIELMQQMIIIDKQNNRRNSSSKKRIANASGSKETPKKWKEDLVGCSIEVWWPLDKMYYKGVVSSYNRLTDRYKVLYADGDEEILDLHHEKWRILDETSPGQKHEQYTYVQSSSTTSAKPLKQKGKRKLGSSLMKEAIKSEVPADSSKTEPTKEYEMEDAYTPNTSVSFSVDNLKDDTVPVQTPGIEPTENSIEKIEKDVDHLKNDPVQTPDISHELKLAEKPIDKVVQDGEPNPIVDLNNISVSCDVNNLNDDPVPKAADMYREPNSSEKPTDIEPNTSAEVESANVTCNVDCVKDESVQTSDISRDLKLTEETNN